MNPSQRSENIPFIQKLSDELVSQIAAGEVVERPASVVKELVENSLDAGASQIRVDLRAGGRDWIRVTDNGSGIPAGELSLAFQRHATSKLRRFADLEQIASYGFRGEALPSIASIARVSMFSRQADSEEGARIEIDAGKIVNQQPAGGPVGTQIEVSQLFAAVPARRKFLKSAATEWGHISDGLARTALVLPKVHLEVWHNDKRAILWPACDEPLSRIAAVLSEREAESLVPIELHEAGFSVNGFTSHPERHRSSGVGFYLFVNQRPVKDRLLRHAILEVYRDILPKGRFPTTLLFLEMPSEAVDVNVHPAKTEVRFRDPQAIHQLVRRALQGAMVKRQWIAGRTPKTQNQVLQSTHLRQKPTAKASDWLLARDRSPSQASNQPLFPQNKGKPASTPVATNDAGDSAVRFQDFRLLGQVNAAFLLLESEEGVVLVDQHAAHERVLYEGLRRELQQGKIAQQTLLMPQMLEFEPARASRLREILAAVEAMGFELEAFDAGNFALRALPALLADRDPAGLVEQLLDEALQIPELGEAQRFHSRHLPLLDHIFATLACHSSRRKGDRLSTDEQQALLRSVDEIPWAPTCPHGRPVAITLDWVELEKRFARR